MVRPNYWRLEADGHRGEFEYETRNGHRVRAEDQDPMGISAPGAGERARDDLLELVPGLAIC